jgi:hypothetical protein
MHQVSGWELIRGADLTYTGAIAGSSSDGRDWRSEKPRQASLAIAWVAAGMLCSWKRQLAWHTRRLSRAMAAMKEAACRFPGS